MNLDARWIVREIDRIGASERFSRLDSGFCARTSRRVLAWMRSFRRPTGVSSTGGAAHGVRMEPIRLPHALVAVTMFLPGHRRKRVEVLVDGYADAAVLLRGGNSAVPGMENLLEKRRPVPAEEVREAFPYRRSDADTLHQARRVLMKVRLSRWLPAGTRMGEDLALVAVVQRPYWVRYRRGAGGHIGFRMLCGVTGDPVGPQVQRAFLAAIAAESANPTHSPVE